VARKKANNQWYIVTTHDIVDRKHLVKTRAPQSPDDLRKKFLEALMNLGVGYAPCVIMVRFTQNMREFPSCRRCQRS
jgi:hypothetical protein